ncbi:MAG: hypothetical protein QW567_02250 [Candidatus Hadarchaeales archaeon]
MAIEEREALLERVRSLLRMAEEEIGRRPELSERYVRLAWRIKTRRRLGLPADLRRRFCRKCLTVWVPGLTCRVRIKKGRLTITCLRCGRVIRLPYDKNKEGQRPSIY